MYVYVTNSLAHTSRACGLWACKVFTATDRQVSQERILVCRPHPRICSCSLLSSCHCCCVGILQEGGGLEGGLLQVISTAAQRSTPQHERCQDRSQVRPYVVPAQEVVMTSCRPTCRRYVDHNVKPGFDHIMADQNNAVDTCPLQQLTCPLPAQTSATAWPPPAARLPPAFCCSSA